MKTAVQTRNWFNYTMREKTVKDTKEITVPGMALPLETILTRLQQGIPVNSTGASFEPDAVKINDLTELHKMKLHLMDIRAKIATQNKLLEEKKKKEDFEP